MRQYVVSRLVQTAVTVVLVLVFTFLLIRAIPGDPVRAGLETIAVPEEEVQKVKEDLGLNRPIYTQFFVWVGDLFQGDLGNSLVVRGRSNTSLLKDALPVTIELAAIAMLMTLLFAVPIGVLSAVRQDSPQDYLGRIFAISGLSLPEFFLGTMVITLAARWFGYTPPLSYHDIWDKPLSNLQQMWLPGLILGFRFSAIGMRMVRSALLEVLREDYIRTAYAKGLRERTVISRHALKNSLIPVVTILGTQFAYLIGGSLVIEVIFNLPGLGRQTVEAIRRFDYTLLQADVLFISTVLIFINLAVDLSYAILDPRIKYGR